MSRSLNDLKSGLSALGWKEGEHYKLEPFTAQGRTERLPDLAAEIATKNVALIVTTSAQATAAVHRASPGTAIVMAGGADPVISGFAKSLGRPGGMITGISNMSADISEKYIDVLITVAPKTKCVGILVDSRNPTRASLVASARRSALNYKIETRIAEIASPEEIESAIPRFVKEAVQALVVMSSPTFFSARQRIIELALTHRWPVIASDGVFPSDGALMSYGIDRREIYVRAAYYVDKILKGAKPGGLPIEQPTRFELVINLKTAKALGITIPQSVLIRADRVIE